jgi:hypothetical protein
MAAPQLYQYRTGGRRAGRASAASLDRRNLDKEVLTGQIGGVKASDLEERFWRSLNKVELPSDFRFRISSALTGKQQLTRRFLNETGEVEIDFLVHKNGITTPVFIDGQIGHFFTDYQADKDALKTNAANEFGASIGWRPSVRVPFWKLTDQTTTDRTVRELFSGEFFATRESVITVDGGQITNDGSGYNWKTPGNVQAEAGYVYTAPVQPKPASPHAVDITLKTPVIEEDNTRILRHKKYLTSIGAL